LKRKKGRRIADPRREREILGKQLGVARDLGLDLDFTKDLFTAIFHLAKSTQRKLNGTMRP
jgi:chorismate mutase